MHQEYVRPAEIRDAHALAADMRPHDIEECRAFGREPLEALLFPFLARQQAFTITDEQDTVYAMFGVTDGITFGCPWMLTSNKFHKVAKPFAQQSIRWFSLMTKDYAYLQNLVSHNNRVAHRWLRHLGFTIETSQPEIYGGVTFYRFWRSNV